MALELTGKLLQKLPLQSGQSAKGPWSKQEFVLETQETYPRKVCLSVWGADKVAELGVVAEGEAIKVSFNLESRCFNERWYTDVRAWRIERLQTQNQGGEGAYQAHYPLPSGTDFAPAGTDASSEMDDLPF